MTLTGNQITDKKLVRAKRMYQHAVLLATGQPDEMARIRAVLEFDWVIEATLKAALGHLNPGKAPSEKVIELVQELDKLLTPQGKAVPTRGHISQVRAVRNAAQHEARDPTATELAACHIYTRDFLITVLHDIWNLALDQISLAALLQTPILAALLLDADRALDAGEWLTATELAMLAEYMAEGRLPDAMQRHHQANEAFDKIPTSVEKMISREVAGILGGIQNVLHVLVLNLDYSRHAAFLHTAGRINVSLYARDFYYVPPATGVDEAFARNTVAYVIDLLLQMEQRLGDLDPERIWPRPPRVDPPQIDAPAAGPPIP